MRASPAFLYCRHAVLFLQGAVGGGLAPAWGLVCVCLNRERNWRRNRYFRATARFSYRFGTELGSNTEPPPAPTHAPLPARALISLRWL